MTSAPPLPKRFKYHVAFSFSSADADYVDRVTAALPEGVKVLNYRTRKSTIELVGHNLQKALKHIYKYEALFVFAFLSKAYEKSKNTQLEWETASRVAKYKPGYVIPVRIEETDMAVSDIWLDGTLPAEQLAELIDGTIRRPPPKPWWFYLSTEVKAAIAAGLLAVIVAIAFSLPSRTSIGFGNANENAITVHVANYRLHHATLVGQRLKFGAIPIEDAELRLDQGESATLPLSSRDVKLTTGTLEAKCNSDAIRATKEEIEALLDQRPVTLEIDIRESDDAPRKSIVTFPAAHLKPLVRKLVEGNVSPCY